MGHLKGTADAVLFCVACGGDVAARLTDGAEVYPHRADLKGLPFWKCDACGNYVGCHHRSRDRRRPLGCIPTADLRLARKHIHAVLDPLWKFRGWTRSEVYAAVARELGVAEFHTAEIRSVEEARRVYVIAVRLASAGPTEKGP